MATEQMTAEIDRLWAENERLRAFEHAGYNPEEPVYGQDYVDRLKAENKRLKAERKALLAFLEESREQVREGANHGSWWCDRRVYDFDRRLGAVLDAAHKAGEEPLPTIDRMAGSDPDFTGEETTAEYLREIGRAGEEPR